MLKLKNGALNFLRANVKPDCLELYIKNIEADASLNGCSNHWRINNSRSKHGVHIDFNLSKDCFEEVEKVEELKPYKWHPAESWDENPNGYWILNFFTDWSLELYTENIDKLCDLTTHFMYIEPLEAEDEAK